MFLRDPLDPRWWRPWQVERAVHLDKIGVDAACIAERVSKTPEQVQRLLRDKRGGEKRKQKSWTNHEDETLMCMVGYRASLSTIAAKLGRTRGSIAGRVHRLRLKTP